MKLKSVTLLVAIILGVIIVSGCTTGPSNQTTGSCGDGTCLAPETCSSCAQDCGACPTSSGKDQLISLVQARYTACHSRGDCEGSGKTITFKPSDAVDNIEIARILNIDYNGINFIDGSGALKPSAELGYNIIYGSGGAPSVSSITPTATVDSYVFVNCMSGQQVCRIEFQKA